MKRRFIQLLINLIAFTNITTTCNTYIRIIFAIVKSKRYTNIQTIISFTHVYRLEMRNRALRILCNKNVDLQPKQGWANIQMSVYTQFIWVKIGLNVSVEWKIERDFATWNKAKSTHIGIVSFWRLSWTILILCRWDFFMLLFRLEILAVLDGPIKWNILTGLIHFNEFALGIRWFYTKWASHFGS